MRGPGPSLYLNHNIKRDATFAPKGIPKPVGRPQEHQFLEWHLLAQGNLFSVHHQLVVHLGPHFLVRQQVQRQYTRNSYAYVTLNS